MTDPSPERSVEATIVRDAALAFAASLGRDLADRKKADLAPFADALLAIVVQAPQNVQQSPFAHPAMDHLMTALSNTQGPQDVIAACSTVSRHVNWYQIFESGSFDQKLAGGMLAGSVAGPTGLVASEQIRTGLFLLAPEIHYPLHTHAATEFYYCLSGRLELQHGIDGTPFNLEAGEISFTPSNRVHSLTTPDHPVLLAFAWMGECNAPNWWWQQDDAGNWERVAWIRRPDGSWTRTVTEPVPPEELEANRNQH